MATNTASDVKIERAVGIVATNSPAYVSHFMELLARGHVVVPLRSRNDSARIDACGIQQIDVPNAGHGWFEGALSLESSDDLAQIAFTSGTEGEPKGVLLTRRNLSSTTMRLQQAMGLDESIREYVGVPVYHSFGFGRCRVIAYVGGKAYIPETFDLRELATKLASGEINAVSTVPSLWRLVLRNQSLIKDVAHHVRWIEIGSQPMSSDEKRALRELFSEARIVQHYGLTEASRTTFLDVDTASEERLASVGRPNGDVEVRINDEGKIQIRGSHVAAEVMVGGIRRKNVDADGWLTTNDFGALSNGDLYFSGRADDVINIGGIKIAPEAVEQKIASELRGIDGICVVRISDDTRGDGVLVAASDNVAVADEVIKVAAEAALRALGVEASTALSFTRLAEIPKTESGKVKRKDVALQFERARSWTTTEREGRRFTRKPKTVRAMFERSFPGATVRDELTFVDLGGDSLSFVELSAALEQRLGFLPKDWSKLSVAELEAIPQKREWLHPVDTSIFLRCVGIVSVVMGHFNVADVAGATFLLLLISGHTFARFQLKNVLARDSVASILISVSRIAVPAALAIAVLSLKHSEYDVKQLVLLDNWTDVSSNLLDFWYLELLVQLLLIVAALLAIPRVRNWARQAPFACGCGLLLVSSISAIAVPFVWDATHLWNRVPHMLLWLFMLGWLMQLATVARQRWLVAIVVAVLPLIIWREGGAWLGHAVVWVWAGSAALLMLEQVRLPAPLNRMVTIIAGASMFIYILHASIKHVAERLNVPFPPLAYVAIAIMGGVAGSWLWETSHRLIARRLSKRHVEAELRPI